jgi:hypothetical protein
MDPWASGSRFGFITAMDSPRGPASLGALAGFVIGGSVADLLGVRSSELMPVIRAKWPLESHDDRRGYRRHMHVDQLAEWWSSLTTVQQAEAITLTRDSGLPEWLTVSFLAAGLPVIDLGWHGAERTDVVPAAVVDYIETRHTQP